MPACPACGRTFEDDPQRRPRSHCPSCLSRLGVTETPDTGGREAGRPPPATVEPIKQEDIRTAGIAVQQFLASKGIPSTIALPEKAADTKPGAAPAPPNPPSAILEASVSKGPDTPPTPLPSGGSAASRYEVLEPIGKGGMGEVLLSRDKDIQRPVAMKVVRDNDVSPELLSRFVEEAQITGQLEHPNIVPVHELGLRADGRLFFTMKLVRGQDMGKIIAKLRSGDPEVSRQWTLRERLLMFLKVLDAVSFAHSRGVIHRDIKPSNVMVGEFGEVYLMDWGLAKALKMENGQTMDQGPVDGAPRGRAERNEKMDVEAATAFPAGVKTLRSGGAGEFQRTLEGHMVGTPSYMSPEQAAGEIDRIGARSDLYSLGATLYELVTFEPSVQGQNLREILVKIVRGEVVTTRQRRPDLGIPKDLDAVIQRSMATDQDKRYPSVQAFAADLRAFLADEPVTARRLDLLERAGRWAKKHGRMLSAIAIVLVVLLGAAGISSHHARRRAEAEAVKAAKEKEALAMAAEANRARLALFEEKKRQEEEWIPVYETDFSEGIVDPRFQLWIGGQDGSRRLPQEGEKPQVLNGRLILVHSAAETILDWTESLGDEIRMVITLPMHHENHNYRFSIGGSFYNGYRLVIASNYIARAVLLEKFYKGVYTLLDRAALPKFEEGQLSTIEFVKTSSKLTVLLDGNILFDYLEPAMLKGPGHQIFSLCAFAQRYNVNEIEGLKIFRRKSSELILVTEIPRALIQHGQPETAKEYLEELLKTHQSGSVRAEALYLLWKIEWEKGEQDAADQILEKLSSEYPESSYLERVIHSKVEHYCGEGLWVEAAKSVLSLPPGRTRKSLEKALSDLAKERMCREGLDAGTIETLNQTLKLLRPGELIFTYAFYVDLRALKGVPISKLDLGTTGRLVGIECIEGLPIRELNIGTHEEIESLEILRGMPLEVLSCKGTGITDLSPLRGMGLKSLDCSSTRVSDLIPLTGMPLEALECNGTLVSDLGPLAGMPLRNLSCESTRVTDLSPLKGMPLQNLACGFTGVTDLSPLMGMRLQSLTCNYTGVNDLSPLKGMPLGSLWCSNTGVTDLSPLKGMPLEALWCSSTGVTDLSPLKGMPLGSLWCSNTGVTDLSPLKDMPLQDLYCSSTEVTELSPLKGMALHDLWCSFTGVTDLGPLEGMALHFLGCESTGVTDLRPLTGMPLQSLNCSSTGVTDLSPLKGMPLQNLGCSNTGVTDLSPLKGMALTSLWIETCLVEDIAALHNMPIELISCGKCPIRDFSPLLGTPIAHFRGDPEQARQVLALGISLKTINEYNAADFWKLVETAEHLRSGALDPKNLAKPVAGRRCALIPLAMTWDEASEWSRAHGARLFVPRNSRELLAVRWATGFVFPVWVGVRVDRMKNLCTDSDGRALTESSSLGLEGILRRPGTSDVVMAISYEPSSGELPSLRESGSKEKFYFLCEWPE